MSGSASGGIPSPTRNSFPPITPLSGTVVRISIVFDEGTDQSGCDGSEDEVARVLRDRDGFRDRLDARRKHGTGRNLQRRTLYASLPDNSIRSRRFQLQPNQCGPGGVPGVMIPRSLTLNGAQAGNPVAGRTFAALLVESTITGVIATPLPDCAFGV